MSVSRSAKFLAEREAQAKYEFQGTDKIFDNKTDIIFNRNGRRCLFNIFEYF